MHALIATDLPIWNPYTAISIAAMFISLLAFVASQITTRRKEGGDYISRLEDRVDRLENSIKSCESTNDYLRSENIALLRQLAKAGIDRISSDT